MVCAYCFIIISIVVVVVVFSIELWNESKRIGKLNRWNDWKRDDYYTDDGISLKRLRLKMHNTKISFGQR